jgi:hypothetical protein
LFVLIGLFSEGVGPDRISDMVTNLILNELAAFTLRICHEFGVPCEEFQVRGQTFALPNNPKQDRRTPIILVPLDALRELPVALSVEDVWAAAAENAAIRARINDEIGAMWVKVSKEKKSEILQSLLADATYVRELIKRMLHIRGAHYDQTRDPRGLLIWTELAYTLAGNYPQTIPAVQNTTLGELDRVVIAIIEQFQFLLEQRDLWRVLNEAPTRKIEKMAQTLFFAVAYSYIKANNIDVTPEADTNNGPVDFKFSAGDHPKILVELKLSKNDVLRGHDKQLPTYVAAEGAGRSHYVVVDVGSLGTKWAVLTQRRHDAGQIEPRVWLIDALPKASASRR